VTLDEVQADAPEVQATHALFDTYPSVQAVATVADVHVEAPVEHAVQVVPPDNKT